MFYNILIYSSLKLWYVIDTDVPECGKAIIVSNTYLIN
ncbi:hypothetical protein MuYL_2961 [Mucilaginibacter xinganensis]|uniref:Uncharacterized protein n=1 Tax=Mucilaginibacter xinganensis TaxID=1234841 RepID=A0A223NZ40_9SPHI|nr:hypothetical protein MuYL_2961 [Mucilaginibacter xinganensis]